jgi:hypothetical protein
VPATAAGWLVSGYTPGRPISGATACGKSGSVDYRRWPYLLLPASLQGYLRSKQGLTTGPKQVSEAAGTAHYSYGECRSMLSVFNGIGIPFLAIAIFLPLVNIVPLTVMNIPFLYLWMFVWFILTSVCLSVCWFRFDRHRSEQI